MAKALTTFNPGNPDQSWNWGWAGIFLLVSTLLGVALMFVPVHYVIAGVVGLVALTWLAFNPHKLFYLTIFTIPFTDRVRVLPISFSLNDMVLTFTAMVAFVHMVLRGQKVNLRTGIDGWVLTLTIIFFLAGFFSESTNGMQGFFKAFEGFLMLYMTVYFINTKQVTRAQILKTVLFALIFQSVLGIFQSLTGIGAGFESDRGYLGYIGLGSRHVFHGRGTTWHFNTLGNYLVTNVMTFIPLYLFCFKRKKWGAFLGAIVGLAILTTYSRGSLLGLAAGTIFLLAALQPNLKRSVLFVGGFVLFVLVPVFWIFGHTEYVQTVSYNDRLIIWQIPLAAITSSAKATWLGSGLNSYDVVAWPYMPAWIPQEQYHNWFAHNFYLLTVLEMGLIGAAIFFGFLAYLWIDGWRKFKKEHGFMRAYSLAISASMVTVFFVSIFDHSLAGPHFKIMLFLLLGLLYVKRKPVARVLRES